MNRPSFPGDISDALRFLRQEAPEIPSCPDPGPSTDVASLPAPAAAPDPDPEPAIAPPASASDPSPAPSPVLADTPPPVELPSTVSSPRDSLFSDLLPDLAAWSDTQPDPSIPASLAAGIALLEAFDSWLQLLSSSQGIPRDRIWLDPVSILIRSEVSVLASKALDHFVATDAHVPSSILTQLASQSESLLDSRPHQLLAMQYLLGLVDMGSPEVVRLKRLVERLQGGAFVSATQRWVAASFPFLSRLYDALSSLPGLVIRSVDDPWPPGSSDSVPPVFAVVAGPDAIAHAQFNARRARFVDDRGRSSVVALPHSAQSDAQCLRSLVIVLPVSFRTFHSSGPASDRPVHTIVSRVSASEYISLPAQHEGPASLSVLSEALGTDACHALVLVPPPDGDAPAPDVPPSGDHISFLPLLADLPIVLRHCLRMLGVESLFDSFDPGPSS